MSIFDKLLHPKQSGPDPLLPKLVHRQYFLPNAEEPEEEESERELEAMMAYEGASAPPPRPSCPELFCYADNGMSLVPAFTSHAAARQWMNLGKECQKTGRAAHTIIVLPSAKLFGLVAGQPQLRLIVDPASAHQRVVMPADMQTLLQLERQPAKQAY